MTTATEEQQLLSLLRQVLARAGCQDVPEDDAVLQGYTLDSLGLDSMQAMEVVGALESRLGLHLPQHEIARVNLVADLTMLILMHKRAV
jgi:acyl carrier protein